MGNKDKKINQRKIRLLYAALFVLAILIVSAASWYISRHYIKSINQYVSQPEEVIKKPSQPETSSSSTKDQSIQVPKLKLPASAEITMWFAPQAPYADWSEPWQSACEEAAVIIVNHYYTQVPLTKEIMKGEILALVDWENQNWGGNHDLTSEETIKLAELNYGLKGEVITDYDVEKIEQYLVEGVPVIVPADGRKLNNPHFRNGGPTYHMLVLKGYDGNGNFITNDPGIKEGEGYLYPYDIVINAVKNPAGGERSIFVLYK